MPARLLASTRPALFTFLPLFMVLGLAVHGTARAQSCQTTSGIPYGTYIDKSGQTQNLLLDLLTPTGVSTATPLVIWIHGGGWATGSRLPIPSYASGLCSRGYAVASVDYRLTNVALWPAQIADVKGAVRFLRAQAATYNLDPDRFAAWGESAGGHLAAMLGTAGGIGSFTLGNVTVDLEGTTGGNLGVSSRVQAVVDWYGATDFVQMHFYPTTADHDAATSDESVFVGGPIQTRPERDATADPRTYASADDPPFLVMHGTADTLIPFNQSELLVDTLVARGVRATFSPVQNAGHGNSPWTSLSSLWQIVYNFLDQTLLQAPAVTLSVQATANGAESGATPGSFTITRTGSTAAPLAVHWALAGTATAGADYTSPGTSATIPAGAASTTVMIAPLDDASVEGDETVVLSLASDPAYRIDSTQAAATLTIADDENGTGFPAISIVASDPTAGGADHGQFTVTRTGSTAADLAVAYTVSGTAIPGTDYAALSGTVTLPAGSASATIDLAPLAHTPLRPATFAVVTLANSADYTVGSPATASVALAADALPGPVVSVVASDPTAAEPGTDTGGFVVWRTGSTTSPLTVQIAMGGTATNGVDYTSVPGTVTFAAGASRVTVTIQPIDDYVTEPTETVTLTVLPDPSYLVGPYTGSVVTIADDDFPGLPTLTSLAVAPTAVAGGNGATGTVTLSGPAFSGGAVVALTSGDTNSATVPATVTVPAGATTATFAVTSKAVATTAAVQISAFYRGVTQNASLTVQETALASVSLSPNSVAGGCKVPTSKVILTGKAPAGGIVVSLASTDPAATVPASVTVPAGASSAGFTVTVSAVTTTQNGSISATYKGVTQSAGLTVRPITLTGLALSPNPVSGTGTVTGTATLECAAGPGAIQVALSSSSPGVANPTAPTLTIPAGASTGTFTVTTAAVGATSTASIRATATGTTKTVTLTVTP